VCGFDGSATVASMAALCVALLCVSSMAPTALAALLCVASDSAVVGGFDDSTVVDSIAVADLGWLFDKDVDSIS
jgi:hypothetical protein